MDNIGLVIVVIVVLGFVAFIAPKPARRVQKNAPPESGMILPDGKIVHRGKVITGLKLDFAVERKQNEYKPKAWR
jgi:hypothetical protein